jgi:hypothetical protein
MGKIWIESYSPGVPAEIDVSSRDCIAGRLDVVNQFHKGMTLEQCRQDPALAIAGSELKQGASIV